MYYSPRVLCDVLEEMRQFDKMKNYSCITGLIEEAQIMGDRMEHALSAKKEHSELDKEIKELKRKKRKLNKDIKKLEEKLEETKTKWDEYDR